MRRGLADHESRRWSTRTVPPLVVGVVGAAACAVIVILAIAGAPWWVVACAAAGFAVGFIPALVEPRGRRTRMAARGRQALLRSPHDRPYIVPRQSPAPPPDFHGRDEELSKLHDLFIAWSPERTRAILIVGGAGVGKTALAVQFAASHGHSFPGGQLFAKLDHSGDQTPTFTLLGRFLSALGTLGKELPDDLEGRLDLYSSLTANWRGLVVLDDACHAVCVTNLLPSGESCATIVTSRVDLEGLQAHRIELQPLKEGEAVGLLESVIGEERIQADPQSARKIADSGHPLSVRLAGAALANQPYLPLKEALARRDEQQPLLPHETSGAVLKGKLDLSYALLANEERIVLRCLGLLAHSVVCPWELAALLDVDEADAIRLADSLAQAELIRRTSGGRAGVVRFEVHEHVLEYARARMRAEMPEGETRERLEALARARDDRGRRADELAWRLDVIIPSWKDEGLLDKALDEARDALSIAEENGRTREVALALATLGDIQVELGNTDAALEMAQAARDMDDRQPPVRALRCLGKVMRRMRKLDLAQEYLATAMAAALQADDAAEEIRILVEQSAVLALVEQSAVSTLTADNARSVALADEAISLCERRQEHASLRTGGLWARGNALLSLGRADQALIVLEQAAWSASDDQALWRTWVFWLRAKASLETGDLPKAAQSANAAIDSFGTMAHRFGIAHCKLVLGRVCLAESRLDEAITLLTDALRTFQNCNDLWTEGDAQRTLASAMLEADRRSEAVHLLQDAARTFKDLGDETSVADVRLARSRIGSNIRLLRSGSPEPQQSGPRKGH